MRREMTGMAVAAAFSLGLLAELAPPALAQDAPSAQPGGSQAPNPQFDAAKQAADALGPDEVATIQRALIWTGDLNTMASGDFGKRSFEAIRAFQRRIKGKDTGMLLPAERAALDKAAKAAASAYGFKTATEQGVTLGYPAKLATQRSEGRFGPKFSSPSGNVTVDILSYPAVTESGDALFDRLKAERPGRKIVYSLSRPNAFVISGTVDGKSFYMRFLKTTTGSRGFVLGWDPALSPGFDRVAIAMAVSMAPSDDIGAAPVAATTPVSAPPPAPSGPPVPLPPGAAKTPRDGIGIALAGRRDVVTAASLVAGCLDVRTDSGIGRVIAGDTATGLALVRLAGDAPAGLALRTAPLAQGEPLTIIVEADGHPEPTTVTAVAGPGDDTRRFAVALPAGLEALPGAIIDGEGALAGMLEAGSASAVKPLFLTAFLRANGTIAAAAPSGDADMAIVTLTCDPAKQL